MNIMKFMTTITIWIPKLHRAAAPPPQGVASWDLSETAAVAICPAAALARAPGETAARRFPWQGAWDVPGDEW